MNDFDDLDDLFGHLRSAATDAEVAGATSHVEAMARHHRRQKGHTMFTSRRARVATFVAAGVIGFGGVAAAGPGGPFTLTGSDVTSTTSEVTTTSSEVTTTSSEVTTTSSEVTTTSSEVTTTSSEVTTTIEEEVVLDDDAPITQSVIEAIPEAEPEPDESGCVGDGDYANHGEYVSAVARNEPGLEGVEQRDAARSSCGKDATGVDDEVDADDDKVEVEVEDADDGDGEVEVQADDDSNDGDRPEQPGRPDNPGRPESPGAQGNGSKKNSGD